MEIILNQLKQKLNESNIELFIYNSISDTNNDTTYVSFDDTISISSNSSIDHQSDNINTILDIIKEKGNYYDYLVIPETYNNCTPIGCIKLKKYIKIPMIKEIEDNIHIILSEDKSILYICVSFSHPYLWYEVEQNQYDNLHNIIHKIIKLYNPPEYIDNYNKKETVFLGSQKMLNMTKNDLVESIIMGEWNELFTWGSMYDDHPFRETFKNIILSEFQYSKINTYAMQQNDTNYVINVKTQLSKSNLKFIIDDGLFYVTIQYNPLLNQSIQKLNDVTSRQYILDLPIDVIQCLIDYPFATHDGILKLRPLKVENFVVADVLTMYDDNKIKNVIDELQKIISEFKNDDNIYTLAYDLYETYAIKLVFNQILIQENINLSKDEIKKKCCHILAKEYSIVSDDLNELIDKLND